MRVEGELIVSADTAQRNASEYGWPAADELLLYVIHGALHLVGYGDHCAAESSEMRAAEARHLQRLGVPIPAEQSRWLPPPSSPSSPSEVRSN